MELCCDCVWYANGEHLVTSVDMCSHMMTRWPHLFIIQVVRVWTCNHVCFVHTLLMGLKSTHVDTHRQLWWKVRNAVTLIWERSHCSAAILIHNIIAMKSLTIQISVGLYYVHWPGIKGFHFHSSILDSVRFQIFTLHNTLPSFNLWMYKCIRPWVCTFIALPRLSGRAQIHRDIYDHFRFCETTLYTAGG